MGYAMGEVDAPVQRIDDPVLIGFFQVMADLFGDESVPGIPAAYHGYDELFSLPVNIELHVVPVIGCDQAVVIFKAFPYVLARSFRTSFCVCKEGLELFIIFHCE